MTRRLALLCWLTVLATAASGLVGAYMNYMLEPSDPFSAFNHPWQHKLDAAHALLGPGLAMVIGFVLAAHVRVEWRTGSSKRKSGAVLTTLAIALPTTGAILAAYGAPDRPLLAWLHGVTGSLFLLMFVAHGLSAIRARRRAARSRR